jgi:TonB family protein
MMEESTVIKTRSFLNLMVITALMLCIGAFAAPSRLGLFTSLLPYIATQRSAGPIQGALLQTPDTEPMRVGDDYLESKLIKRIDPAYPELAKRINARGTVRVQVTVSAAGEASNVKIIGGGHPLLQPAAWDAVKQWLFSPTYLNGRAVSVVGAVAVRFPPPIRLVLETDGGLKDQTLLPVSIDALKGSQAVITLAPLVPFAVAEWTLRRLQNQGVQGLRLQAPGYLFSNGRLFYVVYPGGNSQLLGVDNSVRPPSLDIDLDRLTATAKASAQVRAAKGAPTMLVYAVCVSEAGQIVAVQGSNDPSDEVSEISTALGKAHVMTAGRRGDVPVPSALMVMIPIR